MTEREGGREGEGGGGGERERERETLLGTMPISGQIYYKSEKRPTNIRTLTTQSICDFEKETKEPAPVVKETCYKSKRDLLIFGAVD